MKTKKCPRCKKEKPVDGFNKNAGRYDGLSAACTPCQKEYMRAHYRNNSAIYKKRTAKRNAKIRTDIRLYIVNYLSSHPCVDCGESDIVVLDFDHVRGKKLFNIGAVGVRSKLEEIVKEIAKCDVRCANCHRRRSAKQCGNYRLGIPSVPVQSRLKF